MATNLAVLQGIAAVATIVSSADSILEEPGTLDARFREIMLELTTVRANIAYATRQILAALDGVTRHIVEDVALNCVSEANAALYSDLLNQNDAEDRAFLAADRLYHETNVTFASAFMHVVNIRLSVVKHFRPTEIAAYDEERRRYLAHLRRWIDEVQATIMNLHTVEVDVFVRDLPDEVRHGRPLRFCRAALEGRGTRRDVHGADRGPRR